MNLLQCNFRLGVALWTDNRVPLAARAIFLFSLIYCFMPYDLIPDNTPYLGYVDDICVTLIGFVLARLLIPFDIIAEHSRQKMQRSSEEYAQRSGDDKVLTSLVLVALVLALIFSVVTYHLGLEFTGKWLLALLQTILFD